MSIPNDFALKADSAICVNIRGMFSSGSGSYGSLGCCLLLGGWYFSRILAANFNCCSRCLVSSASLLSLVLCLCSLAKYLGAMLSKSTLAALLNSCFALLRSILALILLSCSSCAILLISFLSFRSLFSLSTLARFHAPVAHVISPTDGLYISIGSSDPSFSAS